MSRRRDLAWNFTAGVIDAAGWGTGMALISPTTILPFFVGQLTDSPVAIGLIQASMLLGWLVPGIFTAGWAETLPRVKHSVMWIAALERSMLFLLAPLCIWLGPSDPFALLAAFFACWFVMNAAVGANTPGYYRLIATTIPAELRGRLYGIGGAISGLLGAAAALGAGRLLKDGGFPYGFAACFGAAFVAMAVSILPLGFMREAPQPPHALPPREPVLQTLRLIRDDPRLGWLCAAAALFSLNQMASAFYALRARDFFHATPLDGARFTAVGMIVRTAGYLVIGWVADRYGNRLALLISTAAGVGAALFALLAGSLDWFYAVFAWNELAGLGWGVCSINYVLELTPPRRSATYTAVYSLFSGPFRILMPLAGGLVIEQWGYLVMFGAALAGAGLALVLLVGWIREPRDTNDRNLVS